MTEDLQQWLGDDTKGAVVQKLVVAVKTLVVCGRCDWSVVVASLQLLVQCMVRRVPLAYHAIPCLGFQASLFSLWRL